MKRTPTLTCAAAIGLLAILTSAGFAQSADPRAQEATLIDLSFPGGSVVDYIEALRKATKGDLNVIVSPEANAVHMDGVELKRVDVASAIRLLDDYRVEIGGRGIKIGVDQVPSSSRSQAAPIYRLNTQVYGAGAPGRDSSMVWSLAGVVSDKRRAEDVLTAIEANLELFGAEYPAARIKYHRETGLLIVRAHEEQLQSIDQVIGELRAGAGPDAKAQMQKLRVEADAEMASIRNRVHATEEESRHLARELTQWQTRAELYKEALDRREGELSDCRARIRELEDMITTIQRRMLEMERAASPK